MDKVVANTNVEVLGPDVTLEWMYGNRIIAVSASSGKRDAVNTWLTRLSTVMREWPKDKLFLALLDVSSYDATPTPFVRKAAHDLMVLQSQLNMKLCLAMLLTPSFNTRLLQIVSSAINRRDLTMRIFFKKDEAIAWLKNIADTKVL